MPHTQAVECEIRWRIERKWETRGAGEKKNSGLSKGPSGKFVLLQTATQIGKRLNSGAWSCIAYIRKPSFSWFCPCKTFEDTTTPGQLTSKVSGCFINASNSNKNCLFLLPDVHSICLCNIFIQKHNIPQLSVDKRAKHCDSGRFSRAFIGKIACLISQQTLLYLYPDDPRIAVIWAEMSFYARHKAYNS